MSRSVCVAAAGLALAEGQSLVEALAAVTGAGTADVSPGLLAEFRVAQRNQGGTAEPDAAPSRGGG